MDDFKIYIVESLLKESIKQGLLAEWRQKPEMLELMRSKPYAYYLEYKTYAWLLAVDGNKTLWDEKINEFEI